MATSENRSFSLLVSKENIVVGKTKVDRRKKGLSDTSVRKRLGDISNLPKQSKLDAGVDKAQSSPNSDKVYIDKLLKENKSLLELLADKNKLIELSGNELQKVNTNMQKLQQQNFQLAQANDRMLAELNEGKERLKSMQHELGCKSSLLRVKEMELEEKLKIRTCQQTKNQVETSKSEKDAMETVEADQHQQENQRPGHSVVKNAESQEKTDNEKICLRTQPVGFTPRKPALKEEDVFVLKEKAEDQRVVRRRRQSAMFEHKEPKPDEEHMSEMTGSAKVSKCSSSLNITEGSTGRSVGSNELRRLSSARPSRMSAQKVQCYKEVAVNAKMRRPDQSSIIRVMILILLYAMIPL